MLGHMENSHLLLSKQTFCDFTLPPLWYEGFFFFLAALEFQLTF
jgi:hypothetical protein